MNTLDLISELTSFDAVSGYEKTFTEHLCGILKRYTEYVTVDNFNNVIAALKCGKESAEKVMLEAHLDQIGLMVSEISEDGKVKFVNLGGVDPRILPASECFILGKEKIFGIIEAPKSEESPKIENMSVMTGLSKQQLEELINIGDPIVFKAEVTKLCNNQISGRAMDDRAGIASLIKVLDKVSKSKLDFDLYILISSQEELGMHGAYSGVESIKPDVAIAVDVTHGLTPTIKREDGAFATGSGAIICRGPNLHYNLTNRLINIAERNNIPYSIEVASGNSGTDAWAIQTAGDGVCTLLISIPLKYMHTTVETLNISDVDAVANLISDFLLGGDFDA